MNKIIIVGSTGSGKSTLASIIATKLKYPHIQLDKLFWKKDWKWRDDEDFFPLIEQAVNTDNWVLDGNYTRSQHLTFPKADTVIWIDLPFFQTFYQCFIRSIVRIFSRQELWEGTGNRESIFKLFSNESILVWLIKTYKLNKKKYEERMIDSKYSHIKFIRLKSNKEVQKFLNTLGSQR